MPIQAGKLVNVASSNVSVRSMREQDVPGVVSAHLLAFADGFFARLGRKFLTRYYRTFCDGPFAVALVAETDGHACGYLVGIVDPSQHRRVLLSDHGRLLAWWGFLGLARRPLLLMRFVATRSKRYAAALLRARHTDQAEPERVAVLSHIVVAPERRGDGVGTALVDHFLGRAVAAGCERACLVTIAGSGGAGDFYSQMGWTYIQSRLSVDHRRLAYYELDLREEIGTEGHSSGPRQRDNPAPPPQWRPSSNFWVSLTEPQREPRGMGSQGGMRCGPG